MSEMNWVGELAKLTNGEEFEKNDHWDPEPGLHSVKFLNNGKPYTNPKGDPKVVFDIEVQGKKFAWFVFTGKTFNSLYGQIGIFAVNNGNDLTGKEINLVVSGAKGHRAYTIVENQKKKVVAQEALK